MKNITNLNSFIYVLTIKTKGDQIIKMSGPKHDKGSEQTVCIYYYFISNMVFSQIQIEDLRILSRSLKHLKPPHGPLAMMIDKLFANANVNISSSRAMIGRSGDIGYSAWAFLDALKPLGTDPNVYAVPLSLPFLTNASPPPNHVLTLQSSFSGCLPS